jgi:D-amino-acid oxidase
VTTVSINPTIYLPYLQSQLLALGTRFVRRHLNHVQDVFSIAPHVQAIVNCSGILACKLGGVEDKNVFPTRGQTILVRNECSKMYARGRTGREPPGESTYIIPRSFGGGTILGGCRQADNWCLPSCEMLMSGTARWTRTWRRGLRLDVLRSVPS